MLKIKNGEKKIKKYDFKGQRWFKKKSTFLLMLKHLEKMI